MPTDFPSHPPFEPLLLLATPAQRADAQTLASYCRQMLDLDSAVTAEPAATYAHLPLCVLHVVWFPHAGEMAAQNVVARYVAHFGLTGSDAEKPPQTLHTIRNFICAVEEKGVDDFAARVLQNRQRSTPGKNGISKAEAAYRFAQALQTQGVQTIADVMPKLRGSAHFEQTVLAIPGQKSGAVLRHFYRLCGAHALVPFDPAVVTDFVGRALSRSVPLPSSEVQTLLQLSCLLLRADFPALTPAALAEAVRRSQNPTTDAAPVLMPEMPPAPPEPEPLKTTEPAAQSVVSVAPVEALEKAEGERAESEEAASYRVRLREIPADDRPRERLLQYGADVLSLGELLAILLRSGTQQQNVMELANHLLSQHGGLRGVAALTPHELGQINGIGPAKAAQIKAAIEFGRRLVGASPEERAKISSPRDVYHLVGPALRDEKREHFIALLLDTKNGLLRQTTVSVGDLSSSLVHPREVFVDAVRYSAASILVAHNHPSGDPTPSPEDIQVTARLVEAGELLGITVLDHIIVGDAKWVSLKEKGLM